MSKMLLIISLAIVFSGCTGIPLQSNNNSNGQIYDSKQEALAKPYFDAGKLAYRSGDYTLCIKNLEQVLNNFATSYFEEASIYVGASWFLLEDQQKAKTSFISTLRKNPSCTLDKTVFKPEIVAFFEKCKQEVPNR